MVVYDQSGNLIFDSGIVSGSGLFNIAYTNSSVLTIVMNPTVNAGSGDLWDYTVNSSQAKYTYLVLTEDTNKTTTPIKFAPVPFHGFLTNLVTTNLAYLTNWVSVTNSVVVTNTWVTTNVSVTGATGMSDGFENTADAEGISAGSYVDGWRVVSGDVDVFNPTAGGHLGTADTGTNCLDLNGFNAGSISTNFTTIPGRRYLLTFAYTKNPSPANPGYPYFVASANINITGQPTFQLNTDPTMLNSYDDLNWQHASIVFTATGPTTTLQFSSLNSGSGGMLLDTVKVTECVFFNGFRGAAAGDYVAGVNPTFDGWTVNTNQVTVISNSVLANMGTNLLALADGQISRILPTVPGQTYTLTYAYRGPSIVSLWRGENNTVDSVDGNTGTWTGGGTLNSYGPGEVGAAFVIDGIHRDRVDVGNPANLQLQDFTIDAWVKRSSATVASLDENFQDGSEAGPGGFIFGCGLGGYSLALFDDGGVAMSKAGYDDTRVPPAVTDTNWHHVAVTKSGTTLVFYVDGVTQPTPTPSPYNSTFFFAAGMAIGSVGQDWGNTFYGMIDEPSIYNRPLSASEIQAIYQQGSLGLPKFDPAAPTIAQGLAEAQVTVGGTNLIFFGNNTTWQTTNITFTATQSNTVLQVAGLEPGMLLDNMALIPLAATNFTYVTNTLYWTNYMPNGFEGAAAGDYTQSGPFFDGWDEITNQVTVISNAMLAYTGTNLLALADGQISRILPTVPGQTYTLSYAYRGPGIAAWWRGESNAVDLVNGNTGTPSGGITYVAGEVGNAFKFNGTDGYIPVPASSSLNIGTGSGITIEDWNYPDYDSGSAIPMVEWDSSTTDGVQLWDEANHTLYANIQDTGHIGHQIQSAANAISTNSFQHVAVTYDKNSGMAFLYVNGVQVASENFGIFTPQTTYPLNLGKRTASVTGNGEVFRGLLDEVSIYNRALSASEIKAIYNAGSLGKFDPNPGISTPQNLAEAQVTVGGTNLIFFGNNTNWQTTNITFTATQSNMVLQITGIEPGMLLDNFALSYFVITTNLVVTTNLNGGDVFYLPEQSLDTFAGESAQGQWQLEVWDNRAGAGHSPRLRS